MIWKKSVSLVLLLLCCLSCESMAQETQFYTRSEKVSVQNYVNKIKGAINLDNRVRVAKLVGVPLMVNFGIYHEEISTTSELLRYYDQIFTREFKDWALDTTDNDVWYHEGSWGSGAGGLMWLGVEEHDKVTVETLNVDYTSSIRTDSLDKFLNVIYDSLLKLSQATPPKLEQLRQSEKLWINFRDSELRLKYPECVDPEGNLLNCTESYDSDLANFTKSQIDFLNSLLRKGRASGRLDYRQTK